MSIINVLDKKVYNRIAAGEVVERPASIVKELVENSIDAKATEILINITAGGKDLIEVLDNGVGISKDDLLKTILPHATSKIKSADDLERINTLGFRGEALASISSVSKMKISSKTKDSEIGYSFDVDGGEASEITETPCNNGTYISVNNLFFNTPARQKFLKSDRSEENEISDTVARLILANPEVSIKYTINGGIIMQSFGDGIEDALIAVYGLEAYNNCFRISNYVNGLKIEGYIGKHNYTKSNRSYQTAILNGRYILNQTIQTSIHNAYSGYLMKRRYPFYVIYITMPKEVIDVNVTPNKSDVRFLDNSVVYTALYSTISKVLDGTDTALDILTYSGDKLVKSPDSLKNEDESLIIKDKIRIVNIDNEEVETTTYKKDNFDFTPFKKSFVFEDENEFGETSQNVETAKNNVDIFAENKKYIEELESKKAIQQQTFSSVNELNLTYIGQILNSYLIFEGNNNMYIVDQHAAHERLLYNKLVNSRKINELNVQPLLIPYTISINSIEYENLYPKKSYLESLGLDVTITPDKITIYALPFELLDIDLNEFFADIFKDYSLKNETIPEILNEKLMQKACKSAVKAGMELTLTEVNSLIRLLNGNINLKCPHGRPIAIKITKKEIDKWFKRII